MRSTARELSLAPRGVHMEGMGRNFGQLSPHGYPGPRHEHRAGHEGRALPASAGRAHRSGWGIVPFSILGLIIIVGVIRRAWSDVGFFTLALALAGVQTVRPVRPAHAIRSPGPPPALVLAYAGCAGLLLVAPRFSVFSGILVCLIGVGAVLVAGLGGWAGATDDGDPRPRGTAPRPLRRAALCWSAIIVAVGLWELTAYLTGRFGLLPDGTMPSISDLLDPLLDEPLGQVIFVLAWLALGARLLMRAWSAPTRERHR